MNIKTKKLRAEGKMNITGIHLRLYIEFKSGEKVGVVNLKKEMT